MDGFVQRPLTSIVGARGNKNEQVKTLRRKSSIGEVFSPCSTPEGVGWTIFCPPDTFPFFKKKT